MNYTQQDVLNIYRYHGLTFIDLIDDLGDHEEYDHKEVISALGY